MTLATTYKLPFRPKEGQLRVLHVRTVCGNGGGPEKTLLRGAKHLNALGVQGEALYLLDANTSSDQLLADAERSVMPVHVVQERSGLDPAGASAFARLVRHGQFDIVHTHDYKSNTIARVLTPAAKYRIVATAHGYNQTTRREGYYYALEKLLLRRADAVVCPSRRLADLLADSGVSPRRLHVIPNGIDLDEWTFHSRHMQAEVPEILYVGRLSREKNVQALLQATAMLIHDGRACKLTLAGEGPERQQLELLTGQLGIGDAVSFLGRRDDVADLLVKADIFVNPSMTEAMPNSVLEALAVGTPTIATDAGATDELILHENTGLLIPPGDVTAIAGSIVRLMDDPDLGKSMAWRGRDHVTHKFDFSVRMAHIVALYRGVLAAREQ